MRSLEVKHLTIPERSSPRKTLTNRPHFQLILAVPCIENEQTIPHYSYARPQPNPAMNPYGYGSAMVPSVTFNNHHDFYRYLQQANAHPYAYSHGPAHFHTPFEPISRVDTIASTRPKKPKPELCPCCKKSIDVHPSMQPHDEQFTEKCYEHEICMEKGGWKKHLRSTVHTQCPLVGCTKSGADFGSDRRFLQHWRKKHPDKLWAWETYTTFWGAQRVRWRKWNGR